MRQIKEDELKAAYQALSSNKARTIGQELDDEEQLRAKFWSKIHKRSQTMCFYCRSNSQPTPKGEDVPLGMDDEDLINCGCRYGGAMLEIWFVDKGVIPDPPPPKSSGRDGPKSMGSEVKLWFIRFFEKWTGQAPFQVSMLFESEAKKVLAMPEAAVLLGSDDALSSSSSSSSREVTNQSHNPPRNATIRLPARNRLPTHNQLPAHDQPPIHPPHHHHQHGLGT